jgi:hypothetical protein
MAILQRFPRRLHEIRPNGPISGTIHWVQLVGWLPALPNYWTDARDPNDIKDVLLDSGNATNSLIMKDYRQEIIRHEWRAAAHHQGGTGLEQGVPNTKISTDIIEHLRRRNLWDIASALKGTLIGTAWPNHRRHADDPSQQICPRCSRAPETLWHRYWECPNNASIPDEHLYIEESQFRKLFSPTTLKPTLNVSGPVP